LIHQNGLSDELYDKAIQHFGEEKTAQIIMTIITINAWNRIGVGLNMHPE
jgi:alkylhydroperoxidase family enzyme